jgi:hypothetical protein
MKLRADLASRLIERINSWSRLLEDEVFRWKLGNGMTKLLCTRKIGREWFLAGDWVRLRLQDCHFF